MLKTNNTLTVLDLSKNEIGAWTSEGTGHTDWKGNHSDELKQTPEGPAALADGLKANSTVQQLHAKSNSLRAAGAKAISEMLRTNKTLTMVDLSDNEIGAYSKDNDGQAPWLPTPDGPAALAYGLKANSTVQQLDASANGLDQASKDRLTKAKPPQLATLKL